MTTDVLTKIAKEQDVDEKLLAKILKIEQELLDLDSKSDEGTERIRAVLEEALK